MSSIYSIPNTQEEAFSKVSNLTKEALFRWSKQEETSINITWKGHSISVQSASFIDALRMHEILISPFKYVSPSSSLKIYCKYCKGLYPEPNNINGTWEIHFPNDNEPDLQEKVIQDSDDENFYDDEPVLVLPNKRMEYPSPNAKMVRPSPTRPTAPPPPPKRLPPPPPPRPLKDANKSEIFAKVDEVMKSLNNSNQAAKAKAKELVNELTTKIQTSKKNNNANEDQMQKINLMMESYAKGDLETSEAIFEQIQIEALERFEKMKLEKQQSKRESPPLPPPPPGWPSQPAIDEQKDFRPQGEKLPLQPAFSSIDFTRHTLSGNSLSGVQTMSELRKAHAASLNESDDQVKLETGEPDLERIKKLAAGLIAQNQEQLKAFEYYEKMKLEKFPPPAYSEEKKDDPR